MHESGPHFLVPNRTRRPGKGGTHDTGSVALALFTSKHLGAAPLQTAVVHAKRAKRGAQVEPPNPIAFESLYRQWAPDVKRWLKIRGVAADVEDLAQEIFLVAHRRLSAFDGRSPRSWLYQIMRRKVRDYWSSRWQTTIDVDHEVPDETPTAEVGPEDALDTSEKGQALERLLGALNEKERQALLLFELEGASGRRIAEIQNVPLNTAWARIYLARRQLREKLRQVETDWVTPRRKSTE